MSTNTEAPVVLVVEDEYITGADIRTSLIDMGYRAPLVIDNGAEAVRVAGEMRPDVVLMDITLAGEMNGIEAASRIRDEFGIPVIFLTAHSDEATFDRAQLSEPFGYIIKPFEPRGLRISIEMARYKHAIDEQLRASEERYRGFVKNFLGIAYRRSADFSLVFIHGAIEGITGFPERAFEDGTISWEALLHPDDSGYVREGNSALTLGRESSLSREYRILRNDGEIRWIHELVQRVNGTKIIPAYIQGACYDITEQKTAGEAIRIANRKLNLLNNITRHDILNTLHGLLGLLEMAKDQLTGEEEAKRLLADMEISTRQIQKQITFTRNYQDVGVKAPVWQGIASCIRQAVSTVGPHPLSIIVDVDEKIEIFADPLLEKVFYNLIDNALRYGERITRIRFSVKEHGSSLTIFCEDDGVGIPPEDKEQIFEQCIGKNTGMGLFLSREILMITGITISENGEPQQGARFCLEVPAGSWRKSYRL